MNIWSKLITALRGGVNEVGENIVDGQALRILDQEIRDSDNELKRSKSALAEIMAKHKLAEESVARIRKSISDYEQYALQALDKGEEQLATEVAEKIASLEQQLTIEVEVSEGYGRSVSRLRKAVSQAEGHLKRLKQQADTVKATESVQKAQAAVASRYSGSQAKLHTAMDSLERIKQKQAERQAQMEAAAELAEEANGAELDNKLQAAGITASGANAQAVLERLKNKQ